MQSVPESAQQLQQWAVVLTAIGGALLAAWRIWYQAIRPRVRSRVTATKAFVKRLNDGLTSVEQIRRELGDNGGKSVKDQIARIEERTTRIDERARRTDARQSALAAVLEKPVFETDARGLWVDVSHSLEELTGYSCAELENFGWKNAIHEEDRTRIAREWKYAIEDQRSLRADCRVRTKDRRTIVVHLVADPMRDTMARELVGWFGFIEAAS